MVNAKNVDLYGNSNVAILEDYSVERWNDLAQRTNIRSFISVHGRNPLNYTEVQVWVRSFSAQKEKPTAVTVDSHIQSVN